MDVHDNIVKLAKKFKKLELSLCLISKLFRFLQFVVQLYFLYLNHIMKQKGLYSKVDDITKTTKPLI